MVFNSLTFFCFFALIAALHALPISWKARKRNLLIASYLFYASWNPPYVLLLLASTCVDWFAARGMVATQSRTRRRSLLALSLCSNLGLLAAFKYGEFLLDTLRALLAGIGITFTPAAPDLILPVGISFYTFQSLSYSFDVYRRRMRPWPSFLDFALYVSFFPQLVAGPIVRSGELRPQLERPPRFDADRLGWGLALLTLGLFQKIVLADALLAPMVDAVYAEPITAGFAAAWMGTIAFSGQIFFDFSGYTTCAIGVAACLGFTLPRNFRAPYAAVGFSDFWRRWHITLSSWLRDYLYVSIGGNRRGLPRTYANLMFTMLVGGLWHGASWSFVAWGGLHGFYLVAERWLRGPDRPSPTGGTRMLLCLATFAIVTFSWAPFRADDLGDALVIMAAMLGGAAPGLPTPEGAWSLAVVITAMLASHLLLRDSSLGHVAARLPWWSRSVVLAGMLLSILLTPSVNRAFVYFQF